MSSENQGAFAREMALAVKVLAKRMAAQQEVAVQLMAETREAVSTLNIAATKCTSLSSTVSTNIDTTIQTAMSSAGTEAATILTDKFETANDCALKAANRYEFAAQTIGWRMAGTIALVCLVLLGTSVYLIQGSFASLAEIHALRKEKEQLQAAISGLEDRGARSIALCGDKQSKNRQLPCAYVLIDARTNKSEWRLLSAPK